MYISVFSLWKFNAIKNACNFYENLNNSYDKTFQRLVRTENCVHMFPFCLLNFKFFYALIEDPFFPDFSWSWFDVSSPWELFPFWFPIRILLIKCGFYDSFSPGFFLFLTLLTLILSSYNDLIEYVKLWFPYKMANYVLNTSFFNSISFNGLE